MKFKVILLFSILTLLISPLKIHAATLLSDDFTGTTINTTTWTEVDSVSGGAAGNITQNGTLSVANSFVSSNWGATSLVSNDTFSSTSLEVSANMSAGTSALIGYGDYLFSNPANKAYILYLTSPTGAIWGLSWTGGSFTSTTSCGNATAGALYKMKVISGGFEIYKNGTLVCTHNTAVVVNNKSIFLQSLSTASTFDNVLVYGVTNARTVPGAPTSVSATGGNTSAIISFSAPLSNGGAVITSYTATSSPGGFTGSSDSSPITVNGLENGTSYTFTVTATNSVGNSISSSTSNTVVPNPPAVPSKITTLSSIGVNKQVLLGWTAPDPGGDSITDYLIEYKLTSSGSWSTFGHVASTATKIIINGLENGVSYDFRISAINSGGVGVSSDVNSATPNAISNLALVFTGESNSGGLGLNSDATLGELASRSSVQIMNLTSGNFLFENLDIGTNNLRDHNGLSAFYNNSHGFELQLANLVEAHQFPDNEQVYLVKTGQGGSLISDWTVGNVSEYWTKFLQRISFAKTQIPSDRQWVVWLSLGINDSNGSTPTSTWKTAMVSHINKIKTELPGSVIVLTGFQSMGHASYNIIINEIASEEPGVFAVDSTDASLRDVNHWSYSGLKTVTSSMVTVTKNTLGLNYPGLPTGLTATPLSTSVSLTWSAPIASGSSLISDYQVEYKTNSDTNWSIFNDGVSTVASTNVTGLSSGILYNFRISAVNTSGVGNTTSINSTTLDINSPTISSINLSTSSNSATITWTTDELASSIVDYGLNNSYGISTVETDTSPRVISHSVILSSLIACTTYHYRIHSTDAFTNTTTSPDSTFTTIGCSTPGSLGVLSSGGAISCTDTGSSFCGKAIQTQVSPVQNPINITLKFFGTTTLKQGSRNQDVKVLQQYLNAHNYNCGIADGIFGPKTRAALIKFQIYNDLKGDGIFGPKTRAVLVLTTI